MYSNHVYIMHVALNSKCISSDSCILDLIRFNYIVIAHSKFQYNKMQFAY